MRKTTDETTHAHAHARARTHMGYTRTHAHTWRANEKRRRRVFVRACDASRCKSDTNEKTRIAQHRSSKHTPANIDAPKHETVPPEVLTGERTAT